MRRYAYGIPSGEALALIADASPDGVVELGAGTGYWARLLHDRGVDVVAYDLRPPDDGANESFDAAPSWFPVRPGGFDAVGVHPERTLLLVWPTWDESWPGDAAACFHAAGGRRLVFVGEGPGGLTGDSVLHALLGEYGACVACGLGVLDAPCVCSITPRWRRTARVEVPRWAGVEDSCSLYERIDTASSSVATLGHAGARRRRWPRTARRVHPES